MREARSVAAVRIPLESVLRFTGPARVRRWEGRGRASWDALARALLLNVVLFGCFLAVATLVYETNDDLGMQTLASGFYTGHPDPHLVFTNVVIGWVLCLFYRGWQGVNWYWLYLVTVHFVSMTAVAWVVFSRRRSWFSVLGLVAFFLVAETRVLLLLQFTTAAFLAGTAGLLLLVDGLDPDRAVEWPKAVAGVVLVVLMGLIRDAVAGLLVVMAIPFLLERFGWRGRLRLGTAGLICFVLFLAGWQLNRWYYQRDPAWAEFREYNQMRGEIQGTRLTRYAEKAAPAAGWTANDGGMFIDFFLSDPQVFGSVSRLRSFLGELRRLDKIEGHSTAEFHFFLPRLLGYNAGLMMRMAMIAAFWVAITAGAGRTRCLVALAAMYGILLFLSYDLLATSRLPERVACCFPIFTFALCLYWAATIEPEWGGGVISRRRLFPWIAWANAWRWFRPGLVVVTVVCSTWLLSRQARSLWIVNGRNHELKSVSRVILSPVRSLLPKGQKPLFVAMPYDSMLEQCLIFHSSAQEIPFTLVPYGWLSQSPVFLQLLEDCRLKPFAASLLNRSDVFFLMEKLWIDRLRVFYREHCRQEVEFVPAYNSDAVPAYRDCQLHLYQVRVIQSLTPSPAGP